MYARLYSNSMAILFKSKYSNWICRLSIPMFFSSLTSGWTRIFFSMCRRPSCSYQDPRSHNYKIKSQQWVFLQSCAVHTQIIQMKNGYLVCFEPAHPFFVAVAPKVVACVWGHWGCSWSTQSRVTIIHYHFGDNIKIQIFLPEQSPQLLGQLVATHDS